MDLKHFKGSLHPIDRVPADIKALYSTAFEVEPRVARGSRFAPTKWIDQAQSLNIYMAGASGKNSTTPTKLAWVRGLKTTYYLRTQSATHVEISTVNTRELNAVSSVPEGVSAHAAEGPAATLASAAPRQLPVPATDVKFDSH